MDSVFNILSTKRLSINRINDSLLIDSFNFIKIIPIKTTTSLKYSNIIFTSKNAVKNAFLNYKLLDKNYSFFCVGEKTAKFLKKKGVKVKIIEPNAESLANKLVKTKIKGFTFFCGELHLNTLPSVLELNNIFLQKIIVYKTIHTSTKLNKEYNGYVFFSPSSFDSFLLKNTLPETAEIFTIGQTTANSIKEQANNKIIISSSPKIESTLQSIKEYYTYVKK